MNYNPKFTKWRMAVEIFIAIIAWTVVTPPVWHITRSVSQEYATSILHHPEIGSSTSLQYGDRYQDGVSWFWDHVVSQPQSAANKTWTACALHSTSTLQPISSFHTDKNSRHSEQFIFKNQSWKQNTINLSYRIKTAIRETFQVTVSRNESEVLINKVNTKYTLQ